MCVRVCVCLHVCLRVCVGVDVGVSACVYGYMYSCNQRISIFFLITKRKKKKSLVKFYSDRYSSRCTKKRASSLADCYTFSESDLVDSQKHCKYTTTLGSPLSFDMLPPPRTDVYLGVRVHKREGDNKP